MKNLQIKKVFQPLIVQALRISLSLNSMWISFHQIFSNFQVCLVNFQQFVHRKIKLCPILFILLVFHKGQHSLLNLRKGFCPWFDLIWCRTYTVGLQPYRKEEMPTNNNAEIFAAMLLPTFHGNNG